MGGEGLSDAELLKRIASIWLRHREELTAASAMPQQLRELLDEVARRTRVDQPPPRPTLDTPTETPASRRSSATSNAAKLIKIERLA
jgi:hypothetical protein